MLSVCMSVFKTMHVSVYMRICACTYVCVFVVIYSPELVMLVLIMVKCWLGGANQMTCEEGRKSVKIEGQRMCPSSSHPDEGYHTGVAAIFHLWRSSQQVEVEPRVQSPSRTTERRRFSEKRVTHYFNILLIELLSSYPIRSLDVCSSHGYGQQPRSVRVAL